MPLIVEAYVPHAHGWRELGRLNAGDPQGSMSHNPEGREVVVFGCYGDYSLVERSRGGGDKELGAGRVIATLGFETLARLGPGQNFEAILRRDGQTLPTRVRWRHEED